MEYLNGHSLKDLINRTYKQRNKIEGGKASRIIRLILEVVNCLHSLDIAHRDLKPGIECFKD